MLCYFLEPIRESLPLSKIGRQKDPRNIDSKMIT